MPSTTLRIYNTLTNQLEDFVPMNPPRVSFYTCGPTVYDYAHIGNFRTFLASDVLRRVLEYLGYEVSHVMNLTDVGHMTDDSVADATGPDKMEVAADRLREAKKSGKLPEGVDIDPSDPYAIADFYAQAFLDDATRLGIKVALEATHGQPEVMPRATTLIPEMIAFIEKLIERGSAYVVNDTVVYFSVESFPNYGKLSGNTLTELQSGAGGRVDEAHQAHKKHPADFLLWKVDPSHLMKWDSPWGAGYPGWHLECSVMAMNLLGGDTGGMIDIHSGGEDLIFPHHECEIAQSCCASGSPDFAKYWIHSRFLFVDGEKMSKSKGTFYTAKDVFKKGVSPAALRLELIKTHYRSNANFTFQGLKDSERIIKRWHAFLDKTESSNAPAQSTTDMTALETSFRDALANDLNVAGALGIINKWIGATDQPSKQDGEMLRQFDQVLGLLDLDDETPPEAQPAGDDLDVDYIEQLIKERAQARKDKNFTRADEIRTELDQMNIELTDGPEGTTWSRKIN